MYIKFTMILKHYHGRMEAQEDYVFSNVYCNFEVDLLFFFPCTHQPGIQSVHNQLSTFPSILYKNDIQLYPNYLPFTEWWRHSISTVHCNFSSEKINGIWTRSNKSMNNSVYYFLTINNWYYNRVATSAKSWLLEETLNLNVKGL